MRNDFETSVLQTIRYFSFFRYPPNFEEVYTFLKKKTSKKHLASILGKMEEKKLITAKIFNFQFSIFNEFSIINNQIDTPPQYSIARYLRAKSKNNNVTMKQWNNWRKKHAFSLQKLHNLRFRLYIKLLSWFPEIQLVGLSGTVAMMNAKEKDDVDLFIISKKKRMWTARIIALFIAQLLGLRRTIKDRQTQNKVCLNLFMDQIEVIIPKRKQTEYVAHEVLQMKPLINKNFTYEQFLAKNQWVYKIFPNAKSVSSIQFPVSRKKTHNFIGDIIENLLKKLELTIIKQHQTSEIITDSQLWFHPEDFEKKLHGLK